MKKGAVSVLVVLLLSVGCASSQTRIDTTTALAAFHEAGFRNLKVWSNREAFEHLTRRQPVTADAKAADVDTILTRGQSPLTAALAAVRFPSIGAAKRRIANDQSLLHNRLSSQERGTLPHGYVVERLREARVCNVVLTSYNPTGDSVLTARFDRAIRGLKKHC